MATVSDSGHELEENPEVEEEEEEKEEEEDEERRALSSYLKLSFSLFLVSLPKSSISIVPNLQSQNKELSFRLLQAEEQLKQMKSRRKEDSKANARVVEIFASHRNAWQAEEKRFLYQIDSSADEIAHLGAKVSEMEKVEVELKTRVEDLNREVGERDEMINFMSRKTEYGDFNEYDDDDGGGKESGGVCDRDGGGYGGGGAVEESGGEECYVDTSRFGKFRVSEDECFSERDPNGEEMGNPYGQHNGFSPDLLASASTLWAERAKSHHHYIRIFCFNANFRLWTTY